MQHADILTHHLVVICRDLWHILFHLSLKQWFCPISICCSFSENFFPSAANELNTHQSYRYCCEGEENKGSWVKWLKLYWKCMLILRYNCAMDTLFCRLISLLEERKDIIQCKRRAQSAKWTQFSHRVAAISDELKLILSNFSQWPEKTDELQNVCFFLGNANECAVNWPYANTGIFAKLRNLTS